MSSNIIILDILSKEVMRKYLQCFIDIQKEFKYCNWDKKNFMLDLDKKWEFSIFSKLNDKIVGYIISSKKHNNTFYIHLFLVDKSYRNHNIGRQMLKKSIQIAKGNNISKIILRVSKENIKAINFYKNNYFYVTDEIVDDLSGPIPDLLMKLDI